MTTPRGPPRPPDELADLLRQALLPEQLQPSHLAVQAQPFDALFRLEREPGTPTGRYGGGVELFISSPNRQSGFPLRVGAVHDVAADGTYIGAGAGYAGDKLGLDIGVRRQVAGGDETVIQAGLRLYGPRQVPGMGTYR